VQSSACASAGLFSVTKRSLGSEGACTGNEDDVLPCIHELRSFVCDLGRHAGGTAASVRATSSHVDFMA
jgi:hypothetical protein